MSNEGVFQAYERLIRQWQVNLVSRGDLEKIWERHIQDSLKIIELFPDLKFERVLDVGSGAGFPGLPLAMAQPGKIFSLAESIAKKCAFLNSVVSALSLSNVTVLCARSEELGRKPNHRDQYDLAVARALAHPVTALELVIPFARVGGACVFWGSGPDWADRKLIEKAAGMLGGAYGGEKSYFLGGIERKLILIEKTSLTPEKYPRRPGVATKNPLRHD